tara:strand:- start:283 stop:435 length:153 start_codon:yes stop_codon:yes gene_type:complete
MSKKRKLNSKNPKYAEKEVQESLTIKKLECTTANGVKVYSVWDKKTIKNK